METERIDLTVGRTIYIDGQEFIVTGTRVDRVLDKGITGLIWVSDPLTCQQERMEFMKKQDLIDSQRKACDTVTKVMNDGQ